MPGSGRRLVLAVAVLLLAAGAGCTRRFFRERTDKDVEGVITQKNIFPDWAVKNWFVYPHPDARFADPFNPDRPPYPPDDPAARLLSPNPQRPTKRAGVGRMEGEGYLRLLEQWDAENRAIAEMNAPPKEIPPAKDGLPPPDMEIGLAAPRAPERSEWVSARPRDENAVIQASAEEKSDKPTPAVAELGPPTVLPDIITPQPIVEPRAPQAPEKLTQPPKVLDPKQIEPKKIDPKVDQPKQIDPKAKDAKVPGAGDPYAGIDASNDYLRALESNERGYLITMHQALGLGLINSREFQDRREDLYLAALQVTGSRFNFATQAFFTEQIVRDFIGSARTDAGRFWTIDSGLDLRKRFATGAQLLVQLANQIVIDLGSDRPDIAFSNVSLAFIQPFLRGGGRAFTLEDLTLTERNMLYAMRSYARFRKLFYVATVAGQGQGGLGLTNNPYGLQGLSVNLGRGIGGNLTSPVVGYLPMLQQAAAIENQRKNVDALGRLLRLYQAFREGGQQSDLQVGQVEVNYLRSQANLLGAGGGGGGGGGGGIRGYLDSLDNFKLQLGLPMTVGLNLDDSPLQPMRGQLALFEQLYADLAQLEVVSRQYDPNNPPAQFRGYWRRLLTESDLVKGTEFAKGILPKLDALAKLTADELKTRLDALLKEREKLLAEKTERQLKNLPEPPEALQRLATVNNERELIAFELAVREYETKPTPDALQRVSVTFVIVALGARNERVEATRASWPKLPALPVNGVDLLSVTLDEAYTGGTQAALSSRLDLMNARSQVVDAYRQIAVVANSLQGALDVRYDLNATTPPGDNRPFAFSSGLSRHQLTFRFDLPLVRRAERNNYRAALIGYQRQRRTLMAFEDNIANDVRSGIRQLRTQAELYRIQQRTVELAYSQVDNANKVIEEPPRPGQVQDAGSAAAVTQQALNNQAQLLDAQNALYSLWVSYLTARMNLYLNLELMQLDDRGVWIDEQTPGYNAAPQPAPGRERERLPLPTPVGAPDKK
jgi:hypothetical protein